MITFPSNLQIFAGNEITKFHICLCLCMGVSVTLHDREMAHVYILECVTCTWPRVQPLECSFYFHDHYFCHLNNGRARVYHARCALKTKHLFSHWKTYSCDMSIAQCACGLFIQGHGGPRRRTWN